MQERVRSENRLLKYISFLRRRAPSCHGDTPRERERGLTIVEVLVVVAVIGLLVAIALPAIQAAREASRRAQCKNHLRQIGVALHSYHAMHDRFPPSVTEGYSALSMLLPYLGEESLYHSVNFATTIDWEFDKTTAMHTALEVFLCPSDTSPIRAATNYAFNIGTGGIRFDDNGALRPAGTGPSRIVDIVDGSSHTIAASEWLRGPARYWRHEPCALIFDVLPGWWDPALFDDFLQTCEQLDAMTAPVFSIHRGHKWLSGSVGDASYNHVLGPNRRSCANGGAPALGACSAGSEHHQGVNALFLDGTVRFMGDALSLEIWRALGTRNGGESLN